MEKRQTFLLLKQPCVDLIQVVTDLPRQPAAKKGTVERLDQLLKILQNVSAKPDALDPKLSEYVFLPLSHVLRASQLVPVRGLELCLDCISLLLKDGWKSELSAALFAQLLILLTFLASPESAENGMPVTSEELQSAAFRCMAELFTQSSSTLAGRRSLTTSANIPALGRALLVILDSLAGSKSNDVRLRGVAALRTLVLAIDDRDALASFLPRMVSSLTKVLTPSSENRASFRLLEQCLESLSALLLQTVSDRKTKDLPTDSPQGNAQGSGTVLRTIPWLQATAAQIKIALANIVKLRHHNKTEVRHALLQLCLTITQECRSSLSDCLAMMMETLVTLAGHVDNDSAETDLRTLLYSDIRFAELLRESLHGWIISLPRYMQSKDDMGRRQIIHRISVALRLLDREQIDLDKVDGLLAESLRDGVLNILNESSYIGSKITPATDVAMGTSLVLPETRSTSFQPLQLRSKGQDDTMAEFQHLLRQIAECDSSLTVAQDLVNLTRSGRDNVQLASFWLSVNLLKDMIRHSAVIDEFLDFGSPSVRAELLDELYAFSLVTLSDEHHHSDLDCHFQALALEVVALQASQSKEDFRVELIEALYPVLHLLGAPYPTLRNHAITCLNIIAESCGYPSSSDLIVSNVDYVVNAVGLKLNYHDISPEAPQVLLMMMRLCGPSLLPYLDDLVGSMFSALERFHGYPKLVELLFAVLKGMAEEGVKTAPLLVQAGEETKHQKRAWEATTMSEVVCVMDALSLPSKPDKEHEQGEAFPLKPWTDEAVHDIDRETTDMDAAQEDDPLESAEPSPPASRTFDVLLKISELTQHYLTSPSPTLRASLLTLLHTTIPALAKHENSFLPLINTLWPVLLARLEDPEAYIVSNALDIVGQMCSYAGDFMKGRIEGMWEDLKAIHSRAVKANGIRGGKIGDKSITLEVTRDAKSFKSGSELRSLDTKFYVDLPTRLLWDSIIRLLCSIAEHVAVGEEIFDDILDMLDPVLVRSNVRKAAEARNSDAVWLRLSRTCKNVAIIANIGDDSPYTMSLPTGKPRWKFVQPQFR
ncbi:HEAT repeat protein-like protein [Clohesyomyces aquaticus]|uniref:HEAT repeat protein-like protein n=1 Tax=Clohesyomyces aquaticus TaxID=1231657 RepID=A0A1Y1ZYH3_9PLEO|nr:HEAT repeat protein-like protein [Clohesyomyces aquaticus]